MTGVEPTDAEPSAIERQAQRKARLTVFWLTVLGVLGLVIGLGVLMAG